MSIYYHQEFVSPQSLYAQVKEELSSYFASGAIDDIMFPRWTEECLLRLRKSAFKIEETVFEVKDFKGCLPDDFNAVREAWMCTIFHGEPYRSAESRYYQEDCTIDHPGTEKCDPRFNNESCKIESCNNEFNVIHKVTGSVRFTFRREFLLTPGNIHAKHLIGDHSPNMHASTKYSFDIHEGNLVTNFREGTVHLIYYAFPKEGEVMIPDNYWVYDFIRKYITFKCFTKLSNIITDETYNQIDKKKQEAKQESEIAFIICETELKKQTSYEKLRQIKVSYEENNKFRIPGDRSYKGR